MGFMTRYAVNSSLLMVTSFPPGFGLLLLNIAGKEAAKPMTMLDLLDFIYGAERTMPRCRQCWRPMLLLEDENGKFLWCKHCADLRKEEGD